MSTPTQTPATSVTVRLPFSIDASGGLLTTTDTAVQTLDRVQALVGTIPGERVMRSTYGVASTRALFLPEDLASVQLQQAVKDAVSAYEPSAVVVGVTSTLNQSLGLVQLDVQVARSDTPGAESGSTRVVDVAVGGTVSPLGV